MNKKGRAVLDLPTGKDNPRNSEGAFIDLRDGRIMFIYSQFIADSSRDTAPAGLAVIYSSDLGETWSEPKQILSPVDDNNAMNIMSVSLLRMQDDSIGLIYGVRHGFLDGRVRLRRSYDEGQTWGEPTICIPAVGYYVTNNDRVVRLSCGRIIVPGGYHRCICKADKDEQAFDSRSTTYYFYSDDDGKSWKESTPCYMPTVNSASGLQEPGLIELKNGVLWGFARTDLGRHYEMFSLDRGETWTVPQASRFTGPCSSLSMKRDPRNDNLIAVWNPIPQYLGQERFPGQEHFPEWAGGRTPQVTSVSADDGKTWSEPLILDDDPRSSYVYTAIHFVGDDMLLAYCAGDVGDGGNGLSRLRIRKLPIPTPN